MDLASKSILVTGGNGFLGRHLVAELRADGCRDLLIPSRRECDFTQAEQVETLFVLRKPDVVIHLAASVGGIGANRNNPGRFFFENALMGINLIDAARRHHVKKLVVLGTICSYPKFTPVPFREDDFWNGYPEETNAPYGIAKKALLVQCQAYREQYGLNAIFLLPVNLYGPGDNFDLENSHVIPALIRKCVEANQKRQTSITLWGDGSPTREFLYVVDAAQGIIAATKKYEKPEPVNLGSGAEVSIRDLAHQIASLVEFRGEILWDTSYPNGQPRRCLDVTRATAEFGFRAKTSLDQGLKRTVDWYVRSYSQASPREVRSS